MTTIGVKDVYLNEGRFGSKTAQPEVYVITALPYNTDMQTAFVYHAKDYGWSLKAGWTSKDNHEVDWCALVKVIDMAEIPTLSKCIEDATRIINEVAIIEAMYKAFKGSIMSRPTPEGLVLDVLGTRLKATFTAPNGKVAMDWFGVELVDGAFVVEDMPDLDTVKADLMARIEEATERPKVAIQADAEERSARAKLAQQTRQANIQLGKLKSEAEGWRLARA